MNNFNPMLDYQRNQLMAQQAMIQNQLNQINHMNQPAQPQFNPYPQNNQPQFFIRQVGSVDEAKGFPVDPATMYFFLDTGTGKIYMKRLNTDNGKSEFFTYNLQENVETREQIDPMEQINLRLTNIENIIGGIANGKSVSSNESNSKSDGITSGTSDNGGFGSGMGLWALLIFAMFMMNGGNWGGWGNNNGFANAIGYENLATSNEVQRGFDNQNALSSQREILSAVTSGTAQTVASVNQTFHDTLSALNDKYSELVRDVGNVSMAQAQALANQNECCCNTLRAIDGVNYNNAINTASINANTTAQTQKILDAISGNRMADMQNQINQLQLTQALNGVVRYPATMAYNAGTSPFCNCGSCGCGV